MSKLDIENMRLGVKDRVSFNFIDCHIPSIIRLAVEGYSKPWDMRAKLKSLA